MNEQVQDARKWWATALLVGAVVGLLAAFGCENTEPSPEVRAELEAVAERYLNTVAEAYSAGDASLLEGQATRREVLDTAKLLRDLRMTGDRVEATLLSVDVQSVDVFRRVNATLSLLEVWDVRRIDASTGEEVDRNPRAIQESVLQLRKIDGEWKVIARRVKATNRPSNVPFPTPQPEADPGDAPSAESPDAQ